MNARMIMGGLMVLLLAACSTTGSESNQSFAFDYPERNPAPVELNILNGVLNVSSGEIEGVQGEVKTNVSAWRVSQTASGDGGQRISQGNSRNEVIPGATNQWDVVMGTGRPLALTINSQSANANLNLGGLSLDSLVAAGTDGDYVVNFDGPNPLESSRIRIGLTTGSITMTGIFRSRVRELVGMTTGGNQSYEFGGGDLIDDLTGDIETRTGDVVLRIPTGTAARVSFTAASGRVLQTSPEFVEVAENVFETAEYTNGDQPRVQIAVRSVAGDLRLFVMPPL